MIKLLEVPYYSQLGDDADYYVNDCLAAAFRMIWGWYRLHIGKDNPDNVTVNDFARDIYQSSADLGSVLDVYQLPFPRAIPYMPVSKSNGITIHRIEQELQNNHPVIALIEYSKIRAVKPMGHFVVITGYDHKYFTINDPYYVWEDKGPIDVNEGWGLEIHKDLFDTALNPDETKAFSNPYQGLVCTLEVEPNE